MGSRWTSASTARRPYEGGYGGISASVSMQEHFGVSKTSEESHESSEEGTHEESLSIAFTAVR